MLYSVQDMKWFWNQSEKYSDESEFLINKS